jgi:hypothetical protein
VDGLAANEAGEWREALVSAALAAAAPMPTRKAKAPPPCDLRTIEVFGARSADFDAAVAAAAGNHLARWLTTLPPNELHCVSYRRALQELARSSPCRRPTPIAAPESYGSATALKDAASALVSDSSARASASTPAAST